MFSFFLAAFWALFVVERVSAFTNITVGDSVLLVNQIIAVPTSPVQAACATNCTDTSSRFTACAGDDACLCRADTVASLLACETCMLHFLINTNTKAPDFRAGSTPVLGAYAAACSAAKLPLAANQTALVLPSTWDGPFVAVLPVGGAAAAVATGALLGAAALYIMSNLD